MKLRLFNPESNLYRFAEWVQRLVYVNLLWILFSLVGLVIFGFTPATVAMFSIIKKWIRGQENVAIFKNFWNVYKANFIKANILGITLGIIGFILYFDIQFFKAQEGILNFFLYYAVLVASFLYLIVLLYVFPIFVNYDLKLYHVIKNSLLISILSPLQTLMMIGGMVGLYFAFMLLPSLLPFLSGSTLAFVIMWVSLKSFAKVEQKIRDHKQEDPEPEKENEDTGEDEDKAIEDQEKEKKKEKEKKEEKEEKPKTE